MRPEATSAAIPCIVAAKSRITPQRNPPKKLTIPVATRRYGLKRMPNTMTPIEKIHPMIARTHPMSQTQYPMRASMGMCAVWKMLPIPPRNDGFAEPKDVGQAVGVRKW